LVQAPSLEFIFCDEKMEEEVVVIVAIVTIVVVEFIS
jgi:hypothetical protein